MQQISSQANDTKTDIALSFRNLDVGVTLNQSMSWTDHVSTKINQRIGLIRRLRKLLPLQAKVTLLNTLILPLFDYGDNIKESTLGLLVYHKKAIIFFFTKESFWSLAVA